MQRVYVENVMREVKEIKVKENNNLEKKLETALFELADIMDEKNYIDCSKIKFGSYDCYKETKLGFSVDKCLIEEIDSLNDIGINTIGCCCGHAKSRGYIQVTPSHCDKMIELGYEQLSLDEYGNGEWCFKPKTFLS